MNVVRSLYKFLWPVQHSEKSTFHLAFCVLFLLGVIDTLIRTLHDTLLITGTAHGAEALPFIDFWMVLPSAVLATAAYSWLARFLTIDHLFVVLTSGFLLFFICFAFFLYPALDRLQDPALAIWLQAHLSTRLQGLSTAIYHWPLTLFYIVSALWKPLIIVVLLWGSLNRTSSIEQASRLYGPLMLSQSLAGLTAGQISIYLCSLFADPSKPQHEAWTVAFQAVVILIVVLGGCAVFLYHRMRNAHRKLDRPRESPPDRSSPSLFQSIGLLWRSPYLIGIALIILADNIAYILMQPLWKYYLRELYPNPLDFMSYNGSINTFTAGLTAVFALGLSRQMIRRLGWTATAMTTPLVMLTVSSGFFFFILLGHLPVVNSFSRHILGVTPIAAGVFCGAVCEGLCRACKYTLLDTTKELAFIPLDARTQGYAKAAIDGVGGRLGKSAGSLIQQLLLIGSVSMTSSALPTAILIWCFGLIAIQAVRSAGQGFHTLTELPPAR